MSVYVYVYNFSTCVVLFSTNLYFLEKKKRAFFSFSFTPVGIKCNKIAVFFSFSFHSPLPSPSVHPTTLRLSSLSSALPFHQQHRGCTAEGQSRRRQQEEEEGRSSSSSAEGRGERAGWLWMVTRSCRVESAGTSHDSHAEPQDQTDPQRYVRSLVRTIVRSHLHLLACLTRPSPAGCLYPSCNTAHRLGSSEGHWGKRLGVFSQSGTV